MNFEPQKFFIGIIDFFSVLLPGGVLAYLAKDRVASASACHSVTYPLDGADHWMVFLFASYLLGHLVFLFGSLLDEPYDWIRNCTYNGQIERLAAGKKLSQWWARKLARLLFTPKPDAAVIQAGRIKWRALSPMGAEGAINTFQWSKARLLKDHGEGLVAVQRLEADSKFFRSFAVVLMLLAVFAYRTGPQYTVWYLLLLLAALWRYAEQRFKSTQQAYWSVITLESMKSESRADVPTKREAARPTHAGGVVYKTSGGSVLYLLVEAKDNRAELVLPKGHIEPGERARTAAVREVAEETARHACVKDWLGDVPLGNNGPLVRFFLMEIVKDYGPLVQALLWVLRRKPKVLYPEERKPYWLLFDDAVAKTMKFPETRKLLEEAKKKIDALPHSAAVCCGHLRQHYRRNG